MYGTIQNMYQKASNMSPRVIAITNQKGGTGKTTLTALLAYGLVKRGFRVLMVDLDPQAHLSSFFIKANELEHIDNGVLEATSGQRFQIRKVNIDTGRGILGLIPSGLNYIIKVYRGQIAAWDPFALYARLSTEVAINRGYDYVLCDTPPELFIPTLWGLYAADHIIIPSNLEELSLLGVKLLLREVIPDIVIRKKEPPKTLGVVLINVTKKVSESTINKLRESLRRFIEEKMPASVRSHIYENPFFDTVIHRYDDLRDLPYRPRRHEIPLGRVLRKNKDLEREVESFVNEVLNRINSFRGIS
ncbi:MAG: ParA family protein [Infirmifilum sp.]